MESVTYRDTPTCSADVHGGRATPVHDAAGNMTAVPQPDTPTSSYTLTWDAWNRLVKVVDGTTTIAEYAWDGSNRRIVKKIYAAGVLDQTRHIYLSRSNQVLEERVDTSTSADRQFTWGTRYIDDLVLRTRDTDANGTLDESLYALQDANWNAAALVSSTGTVVERFRYTPYGRSTVLDANFTADADGISDYDWEYRFTSREYDSETALHYFRARFYHDGLGRFVGRDPLEFVDGGNLYAGYFVPWVLSPISPLIALPIIIIIVAPLIIAPVVNTVGPAIVDGVETIVEHLPTIDPNSSPRPKPRPGPRPIPPPMWVVEEVRCENDDCDCWCLDDYGDGNLQNPTPVGTVTKEECLGYSGLVETPYGTYEVECACGKG